MSERDRIAAVIAYCEHQAAVSWRDGMTADEAHGRNAVAEEVLRIAAGVTMPAPKPPRGWERCSRTAELADGGTDQCILWTGHDGRCF